MMIPPDIPRRILRRMQFTSDQQGIMRRYLAEDWEDHLERCKSFIISCLEEARPDTVAILGSGWLLDVPMEYLASQFHKVYLVDVIHPRQILHKLRKYPNMIPVAHDLTGGGIRGVWQFVQDVREGRQGRPEQSRQGRPDQIRPAGTGSPVKPRSPSPLDIPFQAGTGVRADYIVSLNVLNQLDILLVDYLKRYLAMQDEDEKAFRRRIQQQHLKLLPPGRSCLITDVEECGMLRDGRQGHPKSLIYADLPSGRKKEEWIWPFDKRGSYSQARVTEMRVTAIYL